MSMITEQVERMRRLADEMEKSTFVHEATHFIAIKVLREAANTIEQLSSKVYASNMERSSAYYNGGWIPVSERLPELNKPLLVTTYHRVYYGHLISESGNYGYPVFRIHGLGDKNRDWVQETISHEPYSLRRIDAWMYLDIPEPYKMSEIPTDSESEE